MKTPPQPTFEEFLDRFPAHELPVTLTEAALSQFERNNDPLTAPMIERFIAPEEEQDQYTEYVPCFRIPETHDFHGVVYWKGGLMHHQFILTSYTKKGTQLSSATIGGMKAENDNILRSIATIDEDWKISIVEGVQSGDEAYYSPDNTTGYQMELLATGEIIFLVADSTSG